MIRKPAPSWLRPAILGAAALLPAGGLGFFLWAGWTAGPAVELICTIDSYRYQPEDLPEAEMQHRWIGAEFPLRLWPSAGRAKMGGLRFPDGTITPLERTMILDVAADRYLLTDRTFAYKYHQFAIDRASGRFVQTYETLPEPHFSIGPSVHNSTGPCRTP